LSLTF
jgi:hypothetical protein